ncbi:MAG: NADH:ubiquinone reductase (Na(+)-transporting) subunit C [Hyphomicrobiales bacterium]|nr:MAG: NADH:ubiquinone reductase (Na(+)-transporting) subunit C [Hyphomicrobiales bacterium]
MFNPLLFWRNFLKRPNDDRIKIFGVAFLVACTASLVVSIAAVNLKPLQEAHLAAERDARMQQMLDTLPGLRDLMLETGVDTLETRMVDLIGARFIAGMDVDNYDPDATAKDPETSTPLDPSIDVAGLKRRANYAPVHLMQRNGTLMLIVLPVYGQGYQSTIRAFLALEPDLNTIAALTIISQGETPGLGARIEDANWQALWPGKEIADETGKIMISVVRGQATALFEVDGISGATLTGNGISNMLKFWLGEFGFGPFLAHLKQEGL